MASEQTEAQRLGVPVILGKVPSKRTQIVAAAKEVVDKLASAGGWGEDDGRPWTGFSCQEIDALAQLCRATGDDLTADAILDAHAVDDDEGDAHYGRRKRRFRVEEKLVHEFEASLDDLGVPVEEAAAVDLESRAERYFCDHGTDEIGATCTVEQRTVTEYED